MLDPIKNLLNHLVNHLEFSFLCISLIVFSLSCISLVIFFIGFALHFTIPYIFSKKNFSRDAYIQVLKSLSSHSIEELCQAFEILEKKPSVKQELLEEILAEFQGIPLVDVKPLILSLYLEEISMRKALKLMLVGIIGSCVFSFCFLILANLSYFLLLPPK